MCCWFEALSEERSITDIINFFVIVLICDSLSDQVCSFSFIADLRGEVQ